MDITRELRISNTGRPYLGQLDLIDHIMDAAADVVIDANLDAGNTLTTGQFTDRVAEVATAMTRRICGDAIKAGRPQVASAVLAAWNAAS